MVRPKNIRKILVIGVGNEYRSDDGIGLIVARVIREERLPSVIVKEESGEGAALMESWQGFSYVIIVDAVLSGKLPGTIFRIDTKKETVPKQFFHYSTHAFSVAEAIELARTMNILPQNLILYGIEGKNFTAGINISASVSNVVKQVVKQIVADAEKVTR
jgi:hydrogenase maturation protease